MYRGAVYAPSPMLWRPTYYCARVLEKNEESDDDAPTDERASTSPPPTRHGVSPRSSMCMLMCLLVACVLVGLWRAFGELEVVGELQPLDVFPPSPVAPLDSLAAAGSSISASHSGTALLAVSLTASSVATKFSSDVVTPALSGGANDAVWMRMRSEALNGNEGTSGKLAFLFLTRGPLPLSPLWSAFFERAPRSLYNVYIHAPPSYVPWDASTGIAALPAGSDNAPLPPNWRYINGSVTVEWGDVSMVDAERRLLATALADDPGNARFVLLSESCIPLRSFSIVHDHLMREPRSFVDSFADVQGRYNDRMSDEGVPASAWRKGSQFFALNREHARLAVADAVVFDALSRHCVTCVGDDGGNTSFCAADEHYLPTLFALHGLEGDIVRHSLTYANWSRVERSHPKRFAVQEATPELISQMRAMTEYIRPLEREHMDCGGDCWLFARKFTKLAGERLLGDFENAGLFDEEAAQPSGVARSMT